MGPFILLWQFPEPEAMRESKSATARRCNSLFASSAFPRSQAPLAPLGNAREDTPLPAESKRCFETCVPTRSWEQVGDKF